LTIVGERTITTLEFNPYSANISSTQTNAK